MDGWMYQSLKLLSSNCSSTIIANCEEKGRPALIMCSAPQCSARAWASNQQVVRWVGGLGLTRQPGCTLGWGVGVEQATRLNVLSARRCCYSAVGESGRFPKLFRLWLKQLRTVTRQKACNANAIQVSAFTDSRVTRSTQSSLIMTLEKAWHNSIDVPSHQHGIFGFWLS